MQQKGALWSAAASAAVVALAMACGGNSRSPVSPTGANTPTAANAAPDGTTLKVLAPVLSSPISGVRLTGDSDNVTLAFQAVAVKYAAGQQPFTYRVELMDAAGMLLETKTGTGLSYLMGTTLDVDLTYQWRVRAELSGAVGPWSTTETFKSIEERKGYIRGSELYDPLIRSVSIGRINGSVTFIPGVGVKINDPGAFIEYSIATLRAGEISAFISNLDTNSPDEDPKYRVLTMRSGNDAINDNPYRMSLEKRGNGTVAWRLLTGAGKSFISAGPAERKRVSFHENLTYFWKATWGGGVFSVLVKEGGVSGRTVYEISKHYGGEYRPFDHKVFIGSPYAAGDRGEPFSCEGMIVRQLWVSPDPRPKWANK